MAENFPGTPLARAWLNDKMSMPGGSNHGAASSENLMGKSGVPEELFGRTESIRKHRLRTIHQVDDAVARRRPSKGSAGAESRGGLDPCLAPWLSKTLATAAAPPVADGILQALVQDVDVVASFCIIWPSEFAFSVGSVENAAVKTEDLFAVPRVTLLSAFGVDDLGPASLSTSWHIERLPAALHRSPFIVPGTAKLALPISLEGHPLGIVGMALARTTGTIGTPSYEEHCETSCSVAENGPEILPDDTHGQHMGGEPPRAESKTSLSPRELEIARYLEEGYNTLNIAAILGVTPNTVRTHVRRAYTKLGVCSRIELLRCLR